MINVYKLVLLGETFVGKSCLIYRAHKNEFLDNSDATIGASFISHSVNIDDKIVKFEVWDTAGSEKYAALMPMYYRNALIAFVLFDITNKTSYNIAKKWIKELHYRADDNMLIYLIGNKKDLENRRVINKTETEQYAKDNNIEYFETSSKTGENVNELFFDAASKMLIRQPLIEIPLDDKIKLKGYTANCNCIQ